MVKVKRKTHPSRTPKTKKQKLSPFAIMLIIVGLLIGLVVGYKFINKTNNPGYIEPSYPAAYSDCQSLTVLSPETGAQATSPLTIDVVVDNSNPDCRWAVFEAQAGSIDLQDDQGNVIGSGVLTTTDDWMTDQPVNYSGTISFDPTQATSEMKLIITEEKASGEEGQQVILPLSY